MGKLKALVTEIQDEWDLPFEQATAIVETVLKTYSEQQGVGTLFDDLRSVVDQYRSENSRLTDHIHSLEEEITRLQQLNADHVRLNTLLEGLGRHENGIELPYPEEDPNKQKPEPTEWR